MAGAGGDQAFAEQLVVHRHHRVAGKAQVIGQCAAGGQLQPGRETAGGDRVAELAVQLAADVARAGIREGEAELEGGGHRPVVRDAAARLKAEGRFAVAQESRSLVFARRRPPYRTAEFPSDGVRANA